MTSPYSAGFITMCVLENTNCSTSNRRRPRSKRSVPSTVSVRYRGLGSPEKS